MEYYCGNYQAKHITETYHRVGAAERVVPQYVEPQDGCASHANSAQQEVYVRKKLLYAPPGKGQPVQTVHRELEEHLSCNKAGALQY